MLQTFAYVRAGSLNDAVKQLDGPGARVHAGGTDLLGCLRDDVMSAEKVVSISRLDDLRGITPAADGGLRIGALTTIADLAAHPGIAEKYAALAQAAAVVASPQLRNQGTIGGNLCQRPRCWYFRGDYHCTRKGGDMCYAIGGENQYHAIFGGGACWIVHPSDTAPALVALDAKLRLISAKGARMVPAEKFFVLPDENAQKENVLAPGELVTEILLPPMPAGMKSAYRKVRARGSWDFAMAGMALTLTMKADKVADARIVLSGVAPIPWRLQAVEKLIIGQKLDAKLMTKAADLAVVGAKPLEQNAYKVAMVRGIVAEGLEKLL
ncbi:MAG: xanthine dehydrogenase family protein subunit M [Acidobacteria bacterium]|nr:xanthine dehydrogenase family protein subunit M [Acidobacteriota bacterium]